MAWKAHPKFMAGKYKALVEELFDRKGATAKARREHIASLIGSLSFLGRMEEASDLYDLVAKKSKNPVDLAASRFFLGIGWTRRSEYERAKKLFDKNESQAGQTPLEQFFVHQGKVFYLYYTGQLALSVEQAELSRKHAIASRDLFARFLATDALGHVHVGTGEIHLGLNYLREAQGLGKKLNNESHAASSAISCRLYEWEFGLQNESLEKFAEAVRENRTENSYSHANMALELARQFTIRGKYAAAAKALELAAPIIYSHQNRRQEIQLNLRLAELSGRRGEFFQARHFLWFSRRLLHKEVDKAFELAALGIERKLELAEGKSVAELDARWDKLASFSPTRDRNVRVRLGLATPEKENPEDKVHVILFQSQRALDLDKKLEPLLHAGFQAEASLLLGMPVGQKAVAVLPRDLGLLVQSAEGVEWKETALSSLQYKLLRSLGDGREQSKEALVKKAWGYAYAPLRHDSMVYAALSALRKALGLAGSWLHPTENGYKFEALLLWPQDKTEKTAPTLAKHEAIPSEFANLNHRQIEIIEWIRATRFISVADCRKRFGVSEITALRDMDGLLRLGIVVRTGKARATRYSLAQGDS